MHDPRESGQRTYDGRLDYAETSVHQQQVFIPNSHVRVVGDNQRAAVIQETYRLLAIGVFAAMASAWLASRSMGVISVMASPIGFLLAMFGLNIVPQMALKAAETLHFGGERGQLGRPLFDRGEDALSIPGMARINVGARG